MGDQSGKSGQRSGTQPQTSPSTQQQGSQQSQSNIDPQTGQPWDMNDPDAVTRKSQQERQTSTRSEGSQGTEEHYNQ